MLERIIFKDGTKVRGKRFFVMVWFFNGQKTAFLDTQRMCRERLNKLFEEYEPDLRPPNIPWRRIKPDKNFKLVVNPRVVTLRIKKKYFDLIAKGKKNHEFRDAKPYYDRLFSKPVDALKLHYQGGVFLEVDVIRIDKTPRHPHLENSDCQFGREVYQITLGRCRKTWSVDV